MLYDATMADRQLIVVEGTISYSLHEVILDASSYQKATLYDAGSKRICEIPVCNAQRRDGNTHTYLCIVTRLQGKGG